MLARVLSKSSQTFSSFILCLRFKVSLPFSTQNPKAMQQHKTLLLVLMVFSLFSLFCLGGRGLFKLLLFATPHPIISAPLDYQFCFMTTSLTLIFGYFASILKLVKEKRSNARDCKSFFNQTKTIPKKVFIRHVQKLTVFLVF